DRRSPYWTYNFQIHGHRFYGSTKKTTRREAEAVERAEREKAKALVAQLTAARTSLKLDDIAGRYWEEVGQHHAGANNTERQIGYLIEFFGKDKIVTEITDDDVARMVAWRRGHQRRSQREHLIVPKQNNLISPFTVNDLTEQLKKLFTRAKLWGVTFAREPQCKRHWLAEPSERVRELSDDEAERLEAATRDDYTSFFAFARASGVRTPECLLRFDQVNGGAGLNVKHGKGGKTVTVSITPTIREILWPLQGQHPVYVFTYQAQRTRDGRVKGERHPLTYSGVKIAWRRLRKRAGVVGFRFHDYRHDLATKLLRDTGNLKLVRRALNDADLKTTTRYAHVLDDEVAEAMERIAKLRNTRRTNLRKVVKL